MVSCVVVSCRNTSTNTSKNRHGVTFHRFPRDKHRRKRWELAISRRGWISTASSTVCSEHFEITDFYLTGGGLRRLSIDAIPTINISPCQEIKTTISQIEKANINPTETPEIIELKQKIRRLEVLADHRKRRLNLMWQAKQRMMKRLQKFRKIIRHLTKIKKDDRLIV